MDLKNINKIQMTLKEAIEQRIIKQKAEIKTLEQDRDEADKNENIPMFNFCSGEIDAVHDEIHFLTQLIK